VKHPSYTRHHVCVFASWRSATHDIIDVYSSWADPVAISLVLGGQGGKINFLVRPHLPMVQSVPVW
jgi:hypothetical protein